MSAASPGQAPFRKHRSSSPPGLPQVPRLHGLAGLDASAALRSRKLWPETASILLLGMNYGPVGIRLPRLRKNRPQISPSTREAATITSLIKGKLKMLGSWLAGEAKEPSLRFFVDTAPVMEKRLRRRRD